MSKRKFNANINDVMDQANEPKEEVVEEKKLKGKVSEKKTKASSVETVSKEEKQVEEKESLVEKKVGRPKGRPATRFSINVPDEYIELLNVASGINFNGNTSAYIVSLIDKDIAENGDIYQQILKIKKK